MSDDEHAQTAAEEASRVVSNWAVNFSPDQLDPLRNMIDAHLRAAEQRGYERARAEARDEIAP